MTPGCATPVVVIGASGFGRECLDTLVAMQTAGADLDIVGVIDDGPADLNRERLSARGVDYLGTLDQWLAGGAVDARFVVGVGDPRIRRRIVDRLDAAGLAAFTSLHPSAVIGSRPAFEDGVVVCAGAVISTNVRLGRHVHVNPSATIGHDAVLDDFVSVNPAAVISGDVVVEPLVLIGAGAIVLQQLRVGEGAVIGAGAVVTKDVQKATTVRGVPAR